MYILLILIVLVAFAVVISIIDNKHMATRRYKLISDKLDSDVKIAFLSDLHGNRLGDNNACLIEAVKNENPDIVIIGGDMITANPGCRWGEVTELIEQLSKLEKPIVYGMGNHEYRMSVYLEDYGDDFDNMMKDIMNAGATVLYNNNLSIKDLNIDIQGLMLDRECYKRFRGRKIPDTNDIGRYIGSRNEDSYRILLAHNPEFFDAYAPHADLVLSGHVHGGIMVLPFVGGVMSPRFTLFPKYDGGRFDNSDFDSTMIISRGLGSHTIPIRIFDPIELVVIELKHS